ncbi:uncharacterized protein LACBIDRAFT_317134 [Laccaria bicolor S238N-H82]|uniref:Predicted protein n=1 Tax=Laccaria bicolor (strain S238N-H82 / ATCC MYA-4686) TaxID=486041 RepID=B0D4H2_LACBS|nr:uncharacterized protein LACBIDRAFT_317134 [Laccaria bicolor S238N-H82]EDR10343.1 predicted protein [Laccaria bicolor S238N-H82]|eukprot:XP_001878793.1 predicted protein [Laccaria bicolor S238N-H82]
MAHTSDRIRQLEDALAILQSTVSKKPHLLLDRELLKIKSSTAELHSAVEGEEHESPDHQEQAEESQYIEAWLFAMTEPLLYFLWSIGMLGGGEATSPLERSLQRDPSGTVWPAQPSPLSQIHNIARDKLPRLLAAKVGWPYILKGRIRYTKRLIGCCILSSAGMLICSLAALTYKRLLTFFLQIVAFFNSLAMRLLGISLAYFSSAGFNHSLKSAILLRVPELLAGRPIIWWEMRGLGVRVGVGSSSIMPLIIPLAYSFLLPHSSSFLYSVTPTVYEDALSPPPALSAQPYTPIALDEDEDGEEEGTLAPGPKQGVALSSAPSPEVHASIILRLSLHHQSGLSELLFTDSPTSDPCFSTIKGIGPTLLYPVPSAKDHWLLSKIIHSVRDYYPLWQLVYQSTVFLSRSSISFGIPALPQSMLPLSAIIQAVILVVLFYESAVGLFDDGDEAWSVLLVFILISPEGICGRLAYVNVFDRVTHEPPDPNTRNNIQVERTSQEREFKIGSIGFADSTGILFASIFAVPTELELCKAQIRRGKFLCKGLETSREFIRGRLCIFITILPPIFFWDSLSEKKLYIL